MATIKDFIKKIGNETVSLEEQQKALAAVEKTIVEAKAKREESIGKNVDLVISALKKIEADLNTKLIELNNTPAKQGVAGPKGEKGRDGRDGKDGYAGKDGKDGVDGKDGKDGQDGISVTDAKVDFDGSLVITLSDGREIDAGTVLSVEAAKHIHSVQTGGTGSTSQAVLDAIAAIQATIATYGTMATQNANNVAITGGNINNAVIGGTTPAAGTFTTITGQTEVLKGTGQNLFLQSSNLSNAPWTFQASTVSTTVATTDPFGGTSAFKLAEDNTTNSHIFYQAPTSIVGMTYTVSVYLKAAERGFALLATATGTPTTAIQINLSNGVVTTGTGTPLNAFSISLGNGWYRVGFSVAATLTTGIQTNTYTSTDGVWANRSYLGTTGSGIYVYGAQLEVGTTANTYIPTTTTAVYGTPSLSFSGVAGLGLQSDGSLYVSPAGTGAIQAQSTTSSATGGNARGANAVDWQTSRTTATQVASGAYSVIAGGYSNYAGGFASTVAGYNNTSSGSYSFLGCGYNNTCSNYMSAVVGGRGNTAAGYHNFIGAGYTNSATASSAVTTQATSTITSGSTAVTLSGSNASIKVGQYITGTPIASDTYVAAISGTSLTLSQNATSSTNATLSFYTPHGVVVGGGNNQATGAYSFIGGGGDAGTSANRNVASGDWSFVGGGWKVTATNAGAVAVGGGYGINNTAGGNTASGTSSFVGSGYANLVSNSYGFVGGGSFNNSSALGGTISGGRYGNDRGITGNYVFPACYQPVSASSGVSQGALLILGRQTTDATATVLTSDSNAATTTNQVILPNNSAYYIKGFVVAGVTGAGNSKGWEVSCLIKRGANAASTSIVGTATVTAVYMDAGASTWLITLTADTTNGGLAVTVTGQAATTIRWVAKLETTEMTY